jgi:uroporphyrinogen decarboxylase
MAMLEDPEWIHDMFDSIVEMLILNYEYVFEKAGLPDGIWIAADMGFRDHPFVSLDTYRECVLPHHKRYISFFKSHGLPVLMHSCGFIEPLVPGMIEAGIDMLQAMEVKAGVDLRRLKPLYGDKIGFCGNVDIRTWETNDRAKVEEEIRAKVLCGKEGGGYIFHSDHSVPESVRLDTYRFALECALKYGTY